VKRHENISMVAKTEKESAEEIYLVFGAIFIPQRKKGMV